jgi:hypothetical protein
MVRRWMDIEVPTADAVDRIRASRLTLNTVDAAAVADWLLQKMSPVRRPSQKSIVAWIPPGAGISVSYFSLMDLWCSVLAT